MTSSTDIESEIDFEELGDITSTDEGDTDNLLSENSDEEENSEREDSSSQEEEEDSDFQDFEIDIDIDSLYLTPVRSQTPLAPPSTNPFINNELDRFRLEWENQLNNAQDPNYSAAPQISPKVQVFRVRAFVSSSSLVDGTSNFVESGWAPGANHLSFSEPTIVAQVLSYLNVLDLCQVNLVASVFTVPVRRIIYRRIYLSSPRRTLEFIELVQIAPLIGEFVQELFISFGNLQGIIRELPIVKLKIEELRKEQDLEENIWYYSGGRSVDPTSIKNITSVEGSQKWKEDIKLQIERNATDSDIELHRRHVLLKIATEAIVSNPLELSQAHQEIISTFKTYPFEETPLDTLVPKLHLYFVQLLSETAWISDKKKLRIDFTSTNQYIDIFLLFFNPQYLAIGYDSNSDEGRKTFVPKELDLPFATSASSWTTSRPTLSVREDLRGLIGSLSKVEYLEIHNSNLESIPNDDSVYASQLEDQAASHERWRLFEFSLNNVSINFVQSSLNKSTSSNASFNPQAPLLPSPLWDLKLFVGPLSRLTKLDLTNVDGFSFQSIINTIQSNSHTLRFLSLQDINQSSQIRQQVQTDDNEFFISPATTTTSTTSSQPTTEFNSISSHFYTLNDKGTLDWTYYKKGTPMDGKSLHMTSKELFERGDIPWEEIERDAIHSLELEADISTSIPSLSIPYAISICSQLHTLIIRDPYLRHNRYSNRFLNFPLEIIDSAHLLAFNYDNLIHLELGLGVRRFSVERWDELAEKVKVIEGKISELSKGKGRMDKGVCSVNVRAGWE